MYPPTVTAAQLGEAARCIAAGLPPVLPLNPAALLPLAAVDCHDTIVLYASNPLLLKAYPALCQQRLRDLEAGRLSGKALQDTAIGMRSERTRLAVAAGRGCREDNSWCFERLEQLTQSSEFDWQERGTAQRFARACHASEWPWLIAHLETVIAARLAARAEAELLQAAY